MLANIRTVDEIVRASDFRITPCQLRHWIFQGKEIGFDRVIIRRGGRVFIDLPAFEAWLEEGRSQPGQRRGKAAA